MLRLLGKGEWPGQDWPSSYHHQGNKHVNKPYWTLRPCPPTSCIPWVTLCNVGRKNHLAESCLDLINEVMRGGGFRPPYFWVAFYTALDYWNTWRCHYINKASSIHVSGFHSLRAVSPGGLRIFLYCLSLSQRLLLVPCLPLKILSSGSRLSPAVPQRKAFLDTSRPWPTLSSLNINSVFPVAPFENSYIAIAPNCCLHLICVFTFYVLLFVGGWAARPPSSPPA